VNSWVDFTEGGDASFVLNADDDSIRVKEIRHGGAFAQEFGIGSDLKLDRAFGGIGCQGFL